MAPSPWKGPVAVYVGAQNDPLPPCSEGWGNTSDWLTGMLVPGTFLCGSCTCSPAASGPCLLTAGTKVDVYQNTGCISPPVSTTSVSVPNTCTTVVNTTTSFMFSTQLLGQAVPPAGSCMPMAGAPKWPNTKV